jgi:hypothetical protein
VPYTDAEARQQLLDALAGATEEIGLALADLGEAYEQLDVAAADRLEEELFRPLQASYGLAQRVYGEFASRYGLPAPAFARAEVQVREHDAKAIMNRAAAGVERADAALGALQDSMLPVDVGDPPLRAGLAAVRTGLGEIRGRTREIIRTLGR